jgi:hypothetical protein
VVQQLVLAPTLPHVESTSAPEPATLLSSLVGAGLLGYAAWRRRQQARRRLG